MQFHRAEKESLQVDHSQALEDKTEQLHYRLELTEKQALEQQEKDAQVNNKEACDMILCPVGSE